MNAACHARKRIYLSYFIRDGGFKCVCNDGFILSSDGKFCGDVDECAENPFVCLHGRCHNTEGK